MVDCHKQQREVHSGEEKIRCIHKEADTFLEIVQPGQCAGCPLSLLRKEKVQDNKKKKWRPPKRKPMTIQEMEGYPPCPYRFIGKEGEARCSITNLGVTKGICGKCDEGVREHVATSSEKVKNYFGAIRRWYALGRPTRTKEEIQKLFEENCKGCDRYDKQKHACKNCGCSVSTKSSPLANKLAMASEPCPLGRF